MHLADGALTARAGLRNVQRDGHRHYSRAHASGADTTEVANPARMIICLFLVRCTNQQLGRGS